MKTPVLTALAVVSTQEASVEHELYRAQINSAESAVRLGENAVAREWLDATEPARRGFEWRVQDASLDESLASWPVGEGYVYAIDVSPDGTRVACGTSTGAVEIRSFVDGAVLTSVVAHKESVTDVDFDPRGERVVTTSFDRTAKVFDARTGALLVDFTQHGFPIGGAAFSPDGSKVASCSYERQPGTVVGTVHVWDPADGSLLYSMQGGRKPLVGIQFSPDGARIAAGSWDFCVFVWDAQGGEPVKLAVPDEGIYNAVDGVAWSPDGKLVAGASKDETARVWNVDSGELVTTLRGHTDFVGKVAFAPDGATIATASTDGTVRLWNVADGSTRAVLRGHADDVTDLAFTPDGARLVSSSEDRTSRVWDACTGWHGGARFETSGAPYVARFSPDDSRIATASFDGRIQLWSATTLDLLASWQAHPENKSCHALGWTPDGRYLVSGSWEPVVRVWDAWTQGEVAAFEQPAGTHYLAVGPDGRLAAACSDKTVIVWDLEARAQAHTFKGHAKSTLAVNFSPDSRLCVSTGRDGRALVWNAANGELRFEIVGPSPDVTEAMFTPDGSQIVVAGRDGTVVLHDARDGSRLRQLAKLRHGIDHIDISPDASRVAAASDVVALIDSASGGVVGTLRPHREHPYNVDFDRRGTRLVSCSTDQSVVVSDIRPLRERLRVRDEALATRERIATEFAGEPSTLEGTLQAFQRVAGDASLSPAVRAAWIEVLTLRADAQKP